MVSPSYFLVMFFIYKVMQFILQKISSLLKKNVQVPSLNCPPPPSSSQLWKYDVFISFRGEDVRRTFVDHFYSALVDRQIHTYKDDETLPRGDSIGPSLLKAIEESKIVVIIFSKNYSDSSWCLDELAYIMKCRDEKGQVVIPVFYDVDPSEVRKQKGDFGKAFAKQKAKNVTKAEYWRKALVDASEIAGWEPKQIANGHESEVIKKIVNTIFDRLFPLNVDVEEDLIGMRSRLHDLGSLLDIGLNGVRMVGIWGVGGSGKTTLANYVVTEFSQHFQGHCIVENVREETNKNGLKKLQEDILSAIFKKEVKVNSVVEGRHQIKTMLCSRNVLVVLDDVDKLDQLDALAGSHNWFGSGSRVIITTRDEHLLRAHKVDDVYPIKLLSHDEAIRFFNRHAFNERDREKDYETLSLRVVSYAAGLPLALKVLGAFLCDKEKNEWMSTLDRLKDIPELEIMEKLKISYDGLKTVEQELFLDIACFFKGKDTYDAMQIFAACDFHPGIGIEVLKQKALIYVVDGKFDMHDLVEEMGHYIVRREHPKNPEKHSRVWKHEEIDDMHLGGATMAKEYDRIEPRESNHYHRVHEHSPWFEKIVSNTKKLRWLSVIPRVRKWRNSTILSPLEKNDKVEAITYEGYDPFYSSCFCNSVSNMRKLRWLKVEMCKGNYVKGPSFLSNELRFLHWKVYPASQFPSSFQPMKLVVLKVDKSMQKQLWKGSKNLPHLKVLRLERMKKLLTTPNFDEIPCLVSLVLNKCKELLKIHPSLGTHTRIECVCISDCYKLTMFPTIVNMENLETLQIENCFLKDGGISSHNGALSNLQKLILSGNDFSRLDINLSRLTQLKLLALSRCVNLLGFPEFPLSLAILKADFCRSLTTLGDCHKNCEWLRQVTLWRGGIINDGNELLQSMIKGNVIENQSMLLEVEGIEVVKRFTTPLVRGSRFRLQLSDNWCNDFCGFLVCVVLSVQFNFWSNYLLLRMKHETTGLDSQHNVVWEENDSDSDGDKYTRVWYVPFGSLKHTTWWDQTYKSILFEIENISDDCHGFGVGLVKKESRNGLIESSLDSSSDYAPHFDIQHDSKSGLNISMTHNDSLEDPYPQESKRGLVSISRNPF